MASKFFHNRFGPNGSGKEKSERRGLMIRYALAHHDKALLGQATEALHDLEDSAEILACLEQTLPMQSRVQLWRELFDTIKGRHTQSEQPE